MSPAPDFKSAVTCFDAEHRRAGFAQRPASGTDHRPAFKLEILRFREMLLPFDPILY
ncbi:hypothetical protein [Ralstonia solanacearum]|uniref:hypothetical protein n=1 Tax=Ralstonia solanacearum TaxID=305 RepID=UPI0019D32277|nr:hypothetical protein [Ralstonia solanacearum]